MNDDADRIRELEQENRQLHQRLSALTAQLQLRQPPTESGTTSSSIQHREQELSYLELRFRLAATAASDAIYDLDLRDHRAWRSAAFTQLIGETPGDGIDWWENRLHPEDRELVVNYMKRAMQSRQAFWQRTYRLRRADGDYATVQDRCFILYDQGEAIRIVGALTDITDRVAADREIRRLASFPGENPNPIFVADATGTLQYINPSGNALLERIDCTPLSLLPDSHARLVQRSLAENREFRAIEAHYRETWIQWYYHPVRAAQLVHIYGVDISERQNREQALRESEARFRSMADSAPVMIWLADASHQRTWRNQRWREFTGEAEGSLESWEDCIHPVDLPRCLRTVSDSLESGAAFRHEYRLRHADGNFRWILETCVPRRTDSELIGFIASALDISDLKDAQEALNQSREKLTFLVENLPGIVWTVDHDLRFTSAAGRGLVELGYTAEDVIGRNISELFDIGDPHHPCLVGHQQAIEGRPDTFEMDVKAFKFRAVVDPLTRVEDGQPGAIGVAQDITSLHEAVELQRRLESKLQQAQKLESLGILAGGIAHDFNNLLAGIMGNAGLALLEMPPDTPYRPILENIETAATRAGELTRQMLAYSGRGKFMIEATDLNVMVSEMVDLLHVTINKNAALHLQNSTEPVIVQADVAQLRQVVMNLITNASDAIGDKPGEIRLRTGIMMADEAYLRNTYIDENLPPGAYAWLEVSDTGCGMTADTQKRIFDPFFTTKFTGRGLGLAAILGIIRGHRGAIRVTSKLNHGTSFKVLLPSDNQPLKPLSAGANDSALSNWGSGTILIIDDEVTIRTVASMIIKRFGFDADVAEDGQIGVEKFRQNSGNYRLVLLDLTMPKLSGDDTFLKLRSIQPDIPIILMSGYSEQEASSQFAGRGLSGFLHKPFRTRDLQIMLQDVLSASDGDGDGASKPAP